MGLSTTEGKAEGKNVYSFYLFEGSCDVGAAVGEWKYIEVRGEQKARQSATSRCFYRFYRLASSCELL